MRTVSATEAKQGLAGVLDLAAHEPVVIRRQKRDVAVVLSMKGTSASHGSTSPSSSAFATQSARKPQRRT